MPDPHQPFDLPSPITVVTGLCLKPSVAPPANEDLLGPTVQLWTACLQVDQDLIERLFQLWNSLLTLDADEISDWSLRARCSIVAPGDAAAPPLLGITATVYANGEVSCAIAVEGVDPALNFVEVIDLGEFERPMQSAANWPGVQA